MIIIRVSAYFIILLQIPVFAQTDSLYSQEHLKEDFRIYRQALEEAHPGLYWYRTKFEMDSIFETASAAVGNSMTEREFFSLMSSSDCNNQSQSSTLAPVAECRIDFKLHKTLYL